MTREPSRRKRGRPPHPDILTPREWQVLDLIRQNLTNEQIAHRLDISPATAKYHVSEILSKLNLTTREQAAAWQPEAGRPWWAIALTTAMRRFAPLSVAKATGIGLALAGLAALAWVVWEAGDAENISERLVAATTIPTPEASSAPSPAIAPPLADLPTSELTIGPGQTARYLEGIYRVTANGTATLLTRRRDQGGSTGFYSLSLDERWIAFPDGGAVYAKDRSGPDPAKLLASFDHVWSVELSPAGDQAVLFARLNGTEGSFLLNMASGSVTPFQPDGLITRGAVWSPDGRAIAFLAGNNETHIYVVSPDGTGLKQLTNVNALFEWSPDSHRIALAGDGLHLMDVDSGQSFSLSSARVSSGAPSWSLDGQRLAFSAYRQDGETFVEEIHLVDMPSSQETIVGLGSAPSLSADGSKLAFIREGILFVISADGSGEQQLIFPTQPFAVRPTWLGDDSLIFNFSPLGSSIQVINVDGTGEVNIADGYGPHWSPDGAWIAFIGGGSGGGLGGRSDIYIMQPEGSGIRKVADFNWDDVIGPCEGGGGPSWSPDGHALTFNDSSNGAIKSVSISGEPNPRTLATGSSPVWSPVGNLVAFAGVPSVPPGNCAVWTVDSSIGGLVEMTEGQRPTWSPDGTRISFVREPLFNRFKAYVTEVAGGQVRELTVSASDGLDSSLTLGSWSANGAEIAVTRHPQEPGTDVSDWRTLEIYAINVESGIARRLALGSDPVWSPDGSLIAYTVREQGAEPYIQIPYIYLVNADGSGQPKLLAQGDSPSWSPDGTRIAFTR